MSENHHTTTGPGLPRETGFALSPVAARIRDLDLSADFVEEADGLLLGTSPDGEAAILSEETEDEGEASTASPVPSWSGTLAPMSETRPAMVRALSGRES